jgi:hypothetical protein
MAAGVWEAVAAIARSGSSVSFAVATVESIGVWGIGVIAIETGAGLVASG